MSHFADDDFEDGVCADFILECIQSTVFEEPESPTFHGAKWFSLESQWAFFFVCSEPRTDVEGLRNHLRLCELLGAEEMGKLPEERWRTGCTWHITHSNHWYDTAGRTNGVTSSLVDSQHPATLATVDPSVGYYPTGALRKMTYGNGLTQAVSLEARLQPCRINLNSSGAYITDGCSDGAISGTIQDFDYA